MPLHGFRSAPIVASSSLSHAANLQEDLSRRGPFDRGRANSVMTPAPALGPHRPCAHARTPRGVTSSSPCVRLLDIDQPHVLALPRGRVRGFTLERLLYFLIALDQDVEIIARPKVSERSQLTVIAS